ncbi:MAG: hypothetical protein HDT28_09510 [Clostridiales bacterium]|nr:hypothetical protein [Clostridiales bacterium]
MDIISSGEYPCNVLSNFYENRFTLDEVECASMEGFLQSLKFRLKRKQRKICALVGRAAKDAGTKKVKWKKTGRLYWNGKKYKRDSVEFDELRRRAYAQLFNNETFRTALMSTVGNNLTHSIGKHDKFDTILTEEEFIGYLTELRDKHE